MRASAHEEFSGCPLVSVEERDAFGRRTIARLHSIRQGEREERGKSAGREIQVFATLGIVPVEDGDGVKVEVYGVRGCRQEAVHHEAAHCPRCDFVPREPDPVPMIIRGYTAFSFGSPFRRSVNAPRVVMFGDGFEQRAILRTDPESELLC
jgi:hypothetical protein